ncbi:MAG: hypothetical protein E3J78_00965 [Candidatus Cloacimonadota bacterium]|nr:MAG: hypothetical protein E3J78_00965 [Candidatus Cloacimonadota bacterium]
MKKKFLFAALTLLLISIFIILLIFIKVIRHSQETIAGLRKERGPQEVEISEIAIRSKNGWELFVEKSSARDIIFHKGKYYIATSGGIIIVAENGTVEKELNTTNGLPENSYLQLLPFDAGILALSAGGKIIRINADILFLYNMKNVGKISGISKRDDDIYLAANRGVYLLREKTVRKLENTEQVKMVKPFMNGITYGTIEGKVYISTPVFNDSITDIDVVNDIMESDGVLYIAGAHGLDIVKGGKREVNLQGEFALSLAEFKGKICCGTFDGRVIIDKSMQRVTIRGGRIIRLRVIEGNLFACTDEGVYRYENEKWSVFYKPSMDFPLQYITALEKSGTELLIGTFEDGCYTLKANRLRRLVIGNDVHEINAIVNEGGSVFIATNSGLFVLNQKGTKKVDGLASHFVNSICVYDKELIAGTSKGFGIVNLANFSIKNFCSFHGLINNRVYAITQIGEKIIAGTLGGISVFDGKIFKNITSANSSLNSNWINGLIATDKRVYIGTYGGGISYLEKEGVKNIEGTETVEVNLHSIFYKKPYLFVGTCKSGLFVYDEEERKGKFLKGYFPLDNVTSILVDDAYFYVGTEQGLYRIKTRALQL